MAQFVSYWPLFDTLFSHCCSDITAKTVAHSGDGAWRPASRPLSLLSRASTSHRLLACVALTVVKWAPPHLSSTSRAESVRKGDNPFVLALAAAIARLCTTMSNRCCVRIVLLVAAFTCSPFASHSMFVQGKLTFCAP